MRPSNPAETGGRDGAGGSVPSRRQVLRTTGVAVAGGLAGCTLESETDGSGRDCEPPGDSAETPLEYATHPDDDVSMYRRGLRHLGYYPDETVPDSVRVSWSFPLNYVGHTAAKSTPVPTPDGETIVFAGDTGRVEGYTPRGENLWTTRTDATSLGFHGSPTIVDGVAYLGGYDGDLYAIDVSSGDLVWRTRRDELGGTLAIGSTPAYYDGALYVVVEYGSPSSGALWKIAPDTGEPLWHDDRIWGQPHPSATIDLEEGKLVTGSNDGVVYCWDFPCLEFDWEFQAGPEGGPQGKEKADGRFNHGAQIKGALPAYDGKVYVGSWDGYFYCLDLEDGEELWSFETGRVNMSSPGIDPEEGIVYAGSDDHHVYALDAETGEDLWSTDVRGRVLGGVTVTAETVLAGSYDTHLYALDRETGERRWRVENRGYVTSAPVPLDGRIYYAERGVVVGYYDDDREEELIEPGHAYCLVADDE
ncbi:PQQ-binding-like beta-propeller repeat protein [Natrialbaceae archaeon GCM10025810]|uniref:outer membrane protein assembly factor BamB family protein n=1 Tax=Halovalidus salilacus TaxID=3075124 RepID=UPI003609B75C